MTRLHEGLEHGDLERLVKSSISIDEFKSKMGSDADICTLAFTVIGKEPAADLGNFVEKSYDYVLDADCSSGEDFEGNYMVFIEIERTKELPVQIVEMVDDILNLTEHSKDAWKFTYYKDSTAHPLTVENLKKVLVLSPEEYKQRYEKEKESEIAEAAALNAYAALANAPVTRKVQQNAYVAHIQSLAGIK